MILTRKLIVPAAILFTAFLVGLFGYFIASLQEAYVETEEGNLTAITNSFFIEIGYQEQLALALATTAADNPAIQDAFANQDRAKLGELILPGYSVLQETDANVIQNRYYFPDGTLFFSANTAAPIENAASPAVLLAGSQQKTVAGMEIQDGALVIRGISPVFHQNKHIGSVEFQIGLDATMLQDMQEKYDVEWRILLSKDLVGSGTLIEPGPNEQLLIVTRTEGATIDNDPNGYMRALTGESVITHPSKNGRAYGLQSSPIFDYAGRIIGVLDILYDHTNISASQNTRLVFAALASIGVLILGLLGLFVLVRRTLQPIQILTRAAADIAEGKAASYVNLEAGDDEIGILTNAFNRMTTQLRGSIVDLEQRVMSRTLELENQSLRLRVAAEIARISTASGNLGDLLERSAQLILDRFRFSFVGIFILDKNHEYATLAAAPTEEGKKMVVDHHRVRVGDGSMIGHVAATGDARINLDTRVERRLTNPSLLLSARSEMALPLKAENRVLGVLEIQSEQPQAFDQDDLVIMQVMADQLATAMERTRLMQEATQNLSELERAYGRYTREGWQKLGERARIRNQGYRFDNVRIEPATTLSDAGLQALEKGESVQPNGNDPHREIAIPIKLRGQTIGVVNAKLKEGHHENTVATLELAIERLSSALESARLYEETSVRADQERAISQISNAITSSSDYETIMRTTVRELGSMLNDTEIAIQILDDSDH